jgi:hypothetical protein
MNLHLRFITKWVTINHRSTSSAGPDRTAQYIIISKLIGQTTTIQSVLSGTYTACKADNIIAIYEPIV